MVYSEAAQQAADEVEALIKRRTELQSKVGILEISSNDLEAKKEELKSKVLELQRQCSQVQSNIDNDIRSMYEKIDIEKSKWQKEKEEQEIELAKFKNDLREADKKIKLAQFSIELQKVELEKQQRDLFATKENFDIEYSDFIKTRSSFQSKVDNYNLAKENLSADKSQFISQKALESVLKKDLDEREQSIIQKEKQAQSLMDEMRIKTLELNKVSRDLETREKVVNSKYLISKRLEKELQIREIRLEDSESVLRTNLSI